MERPGARPERRTFEGLALLAEQLDLTSVDLQRWGEIRKIVEQRRKALAQVPTDYSELRALGLEIVNSDNWRDEHDFMSITNHTPEGAFVVRRMVSGLVSDGEHDVPYSEVLFLLEEARPAIETIVNHPKDGDLKTQTRSFEDVDTSSLMIAASWPS